jgi:hypothetical protein
MAARLPDTKYDALNVWQSSVLTASQSLDNPAEAQGTINV